MTDQPAINIQGLSKSYGRGKFALTGLTLHVNPGEVYGFLGPNGAGKSTTIRTLMNFIQPTGGSATILDKDIVRDSVEIKKSIGYLPSDSALYPKMTGGQFLDYMQALQPGVTRSYRQELVKRFKADPHQKLGELSRGNRQKFSIIQAFMHQPEVLILDEPSSGLDPLMQETFYQVVLEAKQRGASIFTSSHILSEVQKICDRIGIIREGKLISEQSIAELVAQAAQTFDITFADETPLAKLKAIKGVKMAQADGHNVTLHLHGELAPLLAELAKHRVTHLDTHQLDLEELFLRFYQDEEPQA
jgi:ABC-2 type transport system ATP-binding protein